MYPLVCKVDLHAIDVGDLLVGIHLLDTGKNGVDVGGRSKVDAVLGNEIGGKSGTKLGQRQATLGKE